VIVAAEAGSIHISSASAVLWRGSDDRSHRGLRDGRVCTPEPGRRPQGTASVIRAGSENSKDGRNEQSSAVQQSSAEQSRAQHSSQCYGRYQHTMWTDGKGGGEQLGCVKLSSYAPCHPLSIRTGVLLQLLVLREQLSVLFKLCLEICDFHLIW
jgi:hypothetical protein